MSTDDLLHGLDLTDPVVRVAVAQCARTPEFKKFVTQIRDSVDPLVLEANTIWHTCETCGEFMATPECWRCRAQMAERRLSQLSIWGDDDWMRKLAQFEISETSESKPKPRLHALGFQVALGSGCAAVYNAVSRPQILFRPELLTVPPECARGMLLDMQIGNRSCFVDATPVPLSLFNPFNWESVEMMHTVMGRLALDTCPVAMDIKLTVDLAPLPTDPLQLEAWAALGVPVPRTFHCALWGRTPEETTPALLPGPPMLPVHPWDPEKDVLRRLAIEAVQKTPQFDRIVADLRRRLKKQG